MKLAILASLLLFLSVALGQAYKVKDAKNPGKGFTVPAWAADHERHVNRRAERLPPINEPHPRHENPNVILQLSTLKSTHSNLKLTVEGSIPEWVSGVMLRNGFAHFETEEMTFNFLFDVGAGLNRFEIKNGTVHFTNRFLESDYWKHSMEENRFPDAITFGGTTPESNCRADPSCIIHDNLNVGVWKLGEKYFAISDFRPLAEFDPVTLQFIGDHRFNDTFDNILYMMTCAHPVPQPDGSGYFFNYLGKLDLPLMLRNTYEFYRVKDSKPDSQRELIAKIVSKDIAYVHSFAVTENYIVFAQFPLFYDLVKIPLTGGPLVDLLTWDPDKGTHVWVINHKTGRIVKEYDTEAFFSYHHINAFEDEKGDILFDITAFADSSHLLTFFLDSMRQGPSDFYPCSNVRRYRVPLASGGDISYSVVNPACHDLARINEQYWAKPYRYVYAAGEYTEGDLYNCIIKMDLNDPSATTLTWAVHDNYPSEPLFIPDPQGKDEDDGVVISVVLDGSRAQSFLLVLDAKTFEELGRAYVPPAIPFMSHGQFYPHEN